MIEKIPPLNAEALGHIRGIVKAIGTDPLPGVPMAELLALPAILPDSAALTVDFAASRELGHPMVVLRVPVRVGPKPAPCLDSLTAREVEVAGLIAAGLSNKRIAARMFLSLATVKAHVHNILAKTELPNRAAVATAVAGGS